MFYLLTYLQVTMTDWLSVTVDWHVQCTVYCVLTLSWLLLLLLLLLWLYTDPDMTSDWLSACSLEDRNIGNCRACWCTQRCLYTSPLTQHTRSRLHTTVTHHSDTHHTTQLHRIWLFQIRPKPKPNLAETCFLVTEQYASDKTNGVNNAASRYRGSTL